MVHIGEHSGWSLKVKHSFQSVFYVMCVLHLTPITPLTPTLLPERQLRSEVTHVAVLLLLWVE